MILINEYTARFLINQLGASRQRFILLRNDFAFKLSKETNSEKIKDLEMKIHHSSLKIEELDLVLNAFQTAIKKLAEAERTGKKIPNVKLPFAMA